jgi:hypothetical protein
VAGDQGFEPRYPRPEFGVVGRSRLASARSKCVCAFAASGSGDVSAISPRVRWISSPPPTRLCRFLANFKSWRGHSENPPRGTTANRPPTFRQDNAKRCPRQLHSQDPRRVRIDRTKNVLAKIFQKNIEQLCVNIKRTFRRSLPWGWGCQKGGVVKSRVGPARLVMKTDRRYPALTARLGGGWQVLRQLRAATASRPYSPLSEVVRLLRSGR